MSDRPCIEENRISSKKNNSVKPPPFDFAQAKHQLRHLSHLIILMAIISSWQMFISHPLISVWLEQCPKIETNAKKCISSSLDKTEEHALLSREGRKMARLGQYAPQQYFNLP